MYTYAYSHYETYFSPKKSEISRFNRKLDTQLYIYMP